MSSIKYLGKNKGNLLKLSVLLLIALLYFGRSLNGIKPCITGDGVEYSLTTEALYNHLSPDIRYDDVTSFKRAFCKQDKWENNGMGEMYDHIGQWIKEKNTEDLKGKATLLTYRDKQYGYHFFFYSLLQLPGRIIVEMTGSNPIKIFQVTNAFFVVITCFFLLFFSPFPVTQTILITLSFCFTSVYWYLGWTHSEVFVVCVLTIAMWFFFQERFFLGIFLASLAAMQYQPILLILIYMAWVYLIKRGFTLKNFLRASCFGILALWPSFYYLTYFGVINLIGSEDGWVSAEYVTPTRVFGFYFDANQGMILGLPIALGLYLFLCFRKWWRMALRKDIFDFSSFLLIFLIAMTCIVSTICVWSPVGAIINRYATWFAAIILIHLFFMIREFSEIIRISILNYIFLSQLVVILFFDQFNINGWNFEKHGVLAAWFIEEHPSLYNPDPQIFIARTSGIFNFGPASSPIVYLKNNDEMVKMAVHKDSLDNLVNYGFNKDQIKKIAENFNFINGWAYVNKGDFNLTKSGTEIYQIVRKQKVARIELKIKGNTAWMKQIEEKAKNWNKTIDEAVKIDAEWVIEQEEKEKMKAKNF